MAKIAASIEGHYVTCEASSSGEYDQHPAFVNLRCDRGEKVVSAAASTIPTWRCGVNHSAVPWEIQGRLRRELTYHPRQRDTQEWAEQPLLNEAAYLEGSPWRYDDITWGNTSGV